MVRFAEVSFQNYLVSWGCIWPELRLGSDLSGLCTAGVVASRAHWRSGICVVRLQMAIKLNQVKYTHADG